MNEPLVTPPAPVLQRIGQFFVAWAHLDQAAQIAIWSIEGWDPDRGSAATAKKTSGQLLAHLQRLQAAAPDGVRDQLAALLVEADVLLETRNALAHGIILWDARAAAVVVNRMRDLRPGGLVAPKALPLLGLVLAAGNAVRIASGLDALERNLRAQQESGGKAD